MATRKVAERRGAGRPSKFNEPSRPVTVTLPERTLERLNEIDADRARAIVKAVDQVREGGERTEPSVDVIETTPGTACLLISRSRSLATIPWLKLIEVSSSRYLLAIESGTAIEKVEVALRDLIERAEKDWPNELGVLEELRAKFTDMRRNERFRKSEILLVSTTG